MPSTELWAGALSLLLIHGESGCPHSALNAARLLERLSEETTLDSATRDLCERASNRLSQQIHKESPHAGTALLPLADRRTGEGRSPVRSLSWIPACAGMTNPE